MLELVDLGKRIDKEVYRQTYPELQLRLAACQRAVRAAEIPVLVVFVIANSFPDRYQHVLRDHRRLSKRPSPGPKRILPWSRRHKVPNSATLAGRQGLRR